MAKWKMPLKVKIYEAFTVIADKRYEFLSDTQAAIPSTNGQKSYVIEWDNVFPMAMTANDNGTYWKGYIGYTMIAILMAQGKINYDEKIVSLFSGINWNALNKQFNNDYDAAAQHVLEGLKDKIDVQTVQASADNIYRQLQNLSLNKLNKRRKPPR